MKSFDFIDIVRELRKRYQNKKHLYPKGKKGEFWNKICVSLFEKYGERFGYKNLSNFKSDLKQSLTILQKNNGLKKVKKENIENPQEEYHKYFKYGKRFRGFLGREGYTSFTQMQIRDLGLNPDSY